MKHFLIITCCLAALLGVSSTAQAQNLIINSYASGTNLFSLWQASSGQTDPDDTTVTRALGGTYNFFGVGHTTADISTNGNVNFLATGFIPSGTGLPTASYPASILLLGDDLRGYAAIPTRAFENVGANFYSITWENIGHFGQSNTLQNTFQLVWFNGPVTIGGFNFQAGDIAFDYTKISGSFNGNDAVVGLNNQSSAAVLPGTTDGLITNATAPGLLPLDDDRFVLFREAARGGYDASIESLSAVPEPSTIILTATGLGAIVLGYRRHRRRKAKRRASQPKVQTA